jgi:peptidoglycan/LPS O-acetylase OafA/YrhL
VTSDRWIAVLIGVWILTQFSFPFIHNWMRRRRRRKAALRNQARIQATPLYDENPTDQEVNHV